MRSVTNEVDLWKELGSHPNICTYLASELTETKDQGKQMMILCELCDGGHIIDLLENNKSGLTETQIVQVMTDICKGVKHMHDLGIAHRDLKVENILLSGDHFKLCDFGSSSKSTLIHKELTKLEVAKQMEHFEQTTTMMYRPPEMIDRYLEFNVTLQADIWMLGCILFTLCFQKHPFFEAQQLAIINAQYFMDRENEKISEKMRDLVRILLTPNPYLRPDINQLLEILDQYEKMESIPLNKEAAEIKQRQEEMSGVKLTKKQDSWKPFQQQRSSLGGGAAWFEMKEENKNEKEDISWGEWADGTPVERLDGDEESQPAMFEQRPKQSIQIAPQNDGKSTIDNVRIGTAERTWFWWVPCGRSVSKKKRGICGRTQQLRESWWWVSEDK